ncbi:MAG TPA: hypothetical protein VMU71_00480 [Terracidiphilus sp.]|nr:hypothetical protein [Terracidiphilus sp.]
MNAGIHPRFFSAALSALAGAVLALAAVPLAAQYPGQVTDQSKKTPELRAVAVLEWTGDLSKPKTSRLVPITIYDGNQLQDASVYMSRPQPLALDPQVEYQLKKDGKTIGLFDIKNAGQEEGSWVGFGDWKALPKPKVVAMKPAKIDDWNDDDKPVLHRSPSAEGKSKGGSSSGKGSGNNAPAPDPDRPTLHKPSSGSSGSGDDQQQDTAGTAPVDPDRPVLKEPEPQKQQKPANPDDDIAHVDSLPAISDPDRPRLTVGGPLNMGPKVTPTLMGLPPDMQQAVAVSDAKNTPDHPWTFSWANPADEQKMKADMEDIARQALGLTPPPASAPAKPAARHRSAKKKAAPPPPPAEPAPLQDEQFKVFELAYGTGATMVLSADTGGPLDKEKFVTLIAQPDLYGNVRVLFKNVAEGSHLDETPRMRLVDAVDALADNRGELLFELRGQTQRQFALYRVLRGEARQIFVTSAGQIGPQASE